jgi:RNA polymerase sigma-70 factor, ECF subfamily
MRRREDEFEQVAMPHAWSLLRFARRFVHEAPAAEDLVQETLLLAWRGFRRFEPGSNARAWLFRILINALYARNRKMRTSPQPVPLTADIHAASADRLESIDLTQAIDCLAGEQRTVLLLAVVEGFTCREIAGILGIPIGTVMSRLSRARAAMREALSAPRGRSGQAVPR